MLVDVTAASLNIRGLPGRRALCDASRMNYVDHLASATRTHWRLPLSLGAGDGDARLRAGAVDVHVSGFTLPHVIHTKGGRARHRYDTVSTHILERRAVQRFSSRGRCFSSWSRRRGGIHAILFPTRGVRRRRPEPSRTLRYMGWNVCAFRSASLRTARSRQTPRSFAPQLSVITPMLIIGHPHGAQ